jgi:toxin ParE1/3/4
MGRSTWFDATKNGRNETRATRCRGLIASHVNAFVKVRRTSTYELRLWEIFDYVAEHDVLAAERLFNHIEDQVNRLADPKFPRRMGRVPATYELVAHPSYIVLLLQDESEVIAFDILHTSRKYP